VPLPPNPTKNPSHLGARAGPDIRARQLGKGVSGFSAVFSGPPPELVIQPRHPTWSLLRSRFPHHHRELGLPPQFAAGKARVLRVASSAATLRLTLERWPPSPPKAGSAHGSRRVAGTPVQAPGDRVRFNSCSEMETFRRGVPVNDHGRRYRSRADGPWSSPTSAYECLDKDKNGAQTLLHEVPFGHRALDILQFTCWARFADLSGRGQMFAGRLITIEETGEQIVKTARPTRSPVIGPTRHTSRGDCQPASHIREAVAGGNRVSYGRSNGTGRHASGITR